jgi:hypothetical protein
MLSMLSMFADLRVLLQLCLHVEGSTIPCHSEIGFGAELQTELDQCLEMVIVAVVAE